jgi:type IV pilus assembly protein PilK
MGDEQFDRWVRFLERRTGVVVPPTRREFLITNLRGRMRETGHANFDTYYDTLQNGAKGAIEWATLVDRLTVHQTHFFRHQPSFDYVVNQWLEQRKSITWDGTLHAWSVGCATGEEAYSLAMAMESALETSARRVYFGITATDVSQPALAVGRTGIYPASKLKEIPERYLQSFCRQIDGDSFEIIDSLRKRVGFSVFNLLDLGRAPLKQLDLIYCQNVLIYFARERRRDILDAMVALLKPRGLLLLGSGEVLNYTHPLVERVANRQVLAFQRTA